MNRTPEGERWRLHAIKISHFRGVADEQTVRFDGMSGLLHGHNGVGKSTVAQCIQWTLYGRFPQNVLANASLPRFLTPVEGKKKVYSGEVTFQRGAELLTLQRDGAEGSLLLTIGSNCYRDKDAEAKRDELLGLDMDTFVRAVLLQQSRIRGLLLDEPRERNKALDRLLGMDALEQLMAVVQEKPFAEAASALRARIEAHENRFVANEELLRQQRESAEEGALQRGFMAKDFNRVGLQKTYAEVSASLSAAAKKYDVAIDALPTCETIKQASSMHRRVTKIIQTIRTGATLERRRGPVEARLGKLSSLQEDWKEAIDTRDQASAAIAAWVEKNGKKEDVTGTKRRLKKDITAHKKELGAASDLYQLLYDAHAYTEHQNVESCPLCEQTLPRGMKLRPALAKRMKALASNELEGLTAAIEAAEEKLLTLEDKLRQLGELENDLASAQRQVDDARHKAAKLLEGDEIPEPKVAKRIGSAVQKLEKEQSSIQEGLSTMEEELTSIQEQSQRIQDGLVPLLQKREEQSAHEAAWKTYKGTHADERSRADRLDHLAHQLDRIRNALLQAKDELASDSLGRAGPRAAELYRKLVRHPRFDTLRLATQPRSRKVDYSFEVSVGGASKTRLEARLALSDGQLTAAALGVFFALAESTVHGLDFLYVDDPTQNLDLPCKEAMARLIAEIAMRKQVIVSTHDEDFVGLLKAEGFHDHAFVHHLAEWNGNPKYETSQPSSGASPKECAPIG